MAGREIVSMRRGYARGHGREYLITFSLQPWSRDVSQRKSTFGTFLVSDDQGVTREDTLDSSLKECHDFGNVTRKGT
jgi:hypothetical protein